MKSVCALAAGILVLPTIASAGELTNPALSIPAGRFSLGLEYYFNNGDFKPSDPAFGHIRVESNEVYARAAYSAFEGNEIILKVGGADLMSPGAFDNGSDLDTGLRFSAAAGLKQSFGVIGGLRVGGIVQYAYFSDYGQTRGGQDIKASRPWQADLALAASYAGNGWAPYIGPVISWHRFEMQRNGTTAYKASGLAGGFVGLDIWNGRIKGSVEVRYSSQVSAGLTLNYLFP